MNQETNDLRTLTARDLMTSEVIRIPMDMPLREAALLLLKHRVTGAPVVDPEGKCVGILSASDYLRLAGEVTGTGKPVESGKSITCPYLVTKRLPPRGDVALCTLPTGACPLQASGPQETSGGIRCMSPHSLIVDWQIVELENLPEEEVRQFMTTDPITVPSTTPISSLARTMIDSHIHRLIVVDEANRPVGVVSSTDLLEAVASGEAGRTSAGNR